MSVSSDFTISLLEVLELVLNITSLSFNEQLFQQLIGTAMWTKCAPNYSNLYMARKIDSEILRLAFNQSVFLIRMFKRFLMTSECFVVDLLREFTNSWMK